MGSGFRFGRMMILLLKQQRISAFSLASYLCLVWALLVLAGGSVVPQACADSQDGQQQTREIPDPARVLKLAQKKLEEHSRKTGYQVDCLTKGGLSNKGDHEVWMHQVYEEHQGVIRGDLMFVEELQVFRNPNKGAIKVGEKWIPLRSAPAGNRLDRMIHFPSELLQAAVGEARAAQWIEPVVEIDLNDPDYVDPMDPLEEPEGGTKVVVEPPQVSSFERIKIDLKEKLAVQYFNEVQSSGCLGGLG